MGGPSQFHEISMVFLGNFDGIPVGFLLDLHEAFYGISMGFL